MILSEGVIETYNCIANHGPLTAKEIATRTVTALSTTRDRLRAMVAQGSVDFVADEYERLYVIGTRPLQGDVPRRRVTKPEPAARPEDTAAMRERVHAKAIDAGLDVQVVVRAGFRLSVPHPFAEGRVWIDTPGDLDAVLIEMDLGPVMEEEWRAAA